MLVILLWFIVGPHAAIGWKVAAVLFYLIGSIWRLNVMKRIIKLDEQVGNL